MWWWKVLSGSGANWHPALRGAGVVVERALWLRSQQALCKVMLGPR